MPSFIEEDDFISAVVSEVSKIIMHDLRESRIYFHLINTYESSIEEYGVMDEEDWGEFVRDILESRARAIHNYSTVADLVTEAILDRVSMGTQIKKVTVGLVAN